MKFSDILYYLIMGYMTRFGLILWGGGKGAEAPDYRPMAEASEESARLGAELGREQLAEGRRQYDQTMQVAQPVIDQQLELMRQTKQQGDDYYNYMVQNQRPLEQKLQAEADAAGSVAEQERAAGTAIADARQGLASAQNQMLRQGLRYGYSPAKLAAMAGNAANQAGLAQAGAANAARQKEKDVGYAKRMDVAGMYRGLVGASQGAYGLANQSGSGAVSAQNAASNQLLNSMAQGNGAIMTGQGQKVQGLGSVLNAQSSAYATQMAQPSAFETGLKAAAMGAGMYAAMSDRRLKTNVERVGEDPRGFGIYEFEYNVVENSPRFRGVMADEVEEVMPEAVIYNDLGFAMVDYGKLGFPMVEV